MGNVLIIILNVHTCVIRHEILLIKHMFGPRHLAKIWQRYLLLYYWLTFIKNKFQKRDAFRKNYLDRESVPKYGRGVAQFPYKSPSWDRELSSIGLSKKSLQKIISNSGCCRVEWGDFRLNILPTWKWHFFLTLPLLVHCIVFQRHYSFDFT